MLKEGVKSQSTVNLQSNTLRIPKSKSRNGALANVFNEKVKRSKTDDKEFCRVDFIGQQTSTINNSNAGLFIISPKVDLIISFMFITFISLILTSNIIIYVSLTKASIINKIQIGLGVFMIITHITLTIVYQKSCLRNKVLINKYKFYWHLTVIILTSHISQLQNSEDRYRDLGLTQSIN